MKKCIFFICFLMPIGAFASTLSTSCPSGYVAIKETYLSITSGDCPSGSTAAGETDSCLLASPGGSCIMYAPVNVTYTDDTGSYVFTEPCPMTDIGVVPVVPVQ